MGRKIQFSTEEYPFKAEALFLAQHYKQFIAERDRLRALLDSDCWTYTTEMAINDLDNTTVSYDRERVQSSGVSNPVQRIVEKIDDPKFMGRKQAELDKDKVWCEQEYRYYAWAVDVVEVAARERMNKYERLVLKKIMFEGWSYSCLISKLKKGTKMHYRDIKCYLENCLHHLASELALRNEFDSDDSMIQRLRAAGCQGSENGSENNEQKI